MVKLGDVAVCFIFRQIAAMDGRTFPEGNSFPFSFRSPRIHHRSILYGFWSFAEGEASVAFPAILAQEGRNNVSSTSSIGPFLIVVD